MLRIARVRLRQLTLLETASVSHTEMVTSAAFLCECYSDVYLINKLELDKAEAGIAEFISTTLNPVTVLSTIYARLQGRIQKMNLEGANSEGLGDDFSQLKGYLDVLWHLGGIAPLPPPLKVASARLTIMRRVFTLVTNYSP